MGGTEMAATETNCEQNADGEWIGSDGERVRIFGRANGEWDVVRIFYANGAIVRHIIVDCGLTHESALRIASRIINERENA
jgi:hypothetical protein